MYILFFIFFIYFINVSLLFQNQLIVLFFSFFVVLSLLKKRYINIQFNVFQLEWLEWVELIKFFILIKTWNMFYIRFINLKIYNFYKFLNFLKQGMLKLFEIQLTKMFQRHISSVNQVTEYILYRLQYRNRVLRININQDIYLDI